MAEPETGKVNPNPEAAKPAANARGRMPQSMWARRRWEPRRRPRQPASAAPRLHGDRPPPASLCLDHGDRIPGGMVPRVLPFFSAAHSFRAQHRFQDWLSLGIRAGRRYQVSAEIPHLGRSHARPRVRDLRALHAPGLHSGLEAQREQIQVPVPRQRLRQRRDQFRRPAPRPMDRAHVELAPDGQIMVDTSRLYQWPKGQPTHFNDPGAFLTGV